MNEKLTASPLGIYRAHLAERKLAYQYSPQAGRAVFFPRLVCPFTGSTELEWRVSAGQGEVHATTVVHPREGPPYNVALIELAEGFRMMSRVEGVDPHSVHIGQKVRVAFVEEEGQPAPLPVFVPQQEEWT
ncbi:MAG: OB-fold domain-containing protein [Variovorax sp.]|nr:OB-fold domain-containing protein [Variovorax sp.]